jgi:hypothetical protein
MKKLLPIALLVVSLTGLASAYTSGWNYITSLTYTYNAGKLTYVTIWGATTPSGYSQTIGTISDADILAKPDLKNLLINLEQAKIDGQKTHLSSNRTDYYFYAGQYMTIDHEDN